MRNRRFLPSISVLAAFDAVIATGSVTAAARELDLTQSTVSRLIRTLEEQLGRDLFVRHKKRLVPTPAALDLAAVRFGHPANRRRHCASSCSPCSG